MIRRGAVVWCITRPSSAELANKLANCADEIVDLLRAGPLTAREVAAKLRLSSSGVRYWLSRLRRAGRVQSSGRTTTSPENRYSAVEDGSSA